MSISASFPTSRLPICSSACISLAGFMVSSGRTSSIDSPVNSISRFRAVPVVSVLPARTPFGSLASPSSTITSLTPSLYAPSGSPAAIIESVTATTLSWPFAFKIIRTLPGCRCLPSQIVSQYTSSASSTAPIIAGKC